MESDFFWQLTYPMLQMEHYKIKTIKISCAERQTVWASVLNKESGLEVCGRKSITTEDKYEIFSSFLSVKVGSDHFQGPCSVTASNVEQSLSKCQQLVDSAICRQGCVHLALPGLCLNWVNTLNVIPNKNWWHQAVKKSSFTSVPQAIPRNVYKYVFCGV